MATCCCSVRRHHTTTPTHFRGEYARSVFVGPRVRPDEGSLKFAMIAAGPPFISVEQ